ncbi:MAG: hypothetical protein R2766_01065 [Saprospiraceae bacterium]
MEFYTSTFTINNSMISTTISKFDLGGNLKWQFDLPDSIIVNDIQAFDQNAIFIVGQTLFQNGGKSIVGKIIDLGNSYNIAWLNYYDLFYTFSNGEVLNIADRYFNILKQGNSLFVHGSAFIPNSAPQESTMVLELDDSGNVINNYRYYYDRNFNVDPHIWRGFKLNKNNGFMIFGQNNDSGNDGSFIYTNTSSAIPTILIPQVNYFNDGYDIDGTKLLLIGENVIGIYNMDGTISCMKEFGLLQGLRNLFGPFITYNGQEIFYADGFRTVNDTIEEYLVQFHLNNDCIDLDWTKKLILPNLAANNRIGEFSINKINEFIYLGDRAQDDQLDDVILLCIDSTSCYLENINEVLNDKFITVSTIEFVSANYLSPDQLPIQATSSRAYNCIPVDPCGLNNPCDVDTISPICNTQNITVSLDENGQANITPEMIDTGSSDECGPVNLELDITSFTCQDIGVNTVTLTATDSYGNTSQCTSDVTVQDNNQYCDPTCIFSCTEECSTNVVNLSTGIDATTEVFLNIGDYDANWKLISSPDAGIQVPRPAFVLNPNSVWAQLQGSQYISAYPNASNNATNIFDGTYYEFEKCFCVCEDSSEVTIDLKAYVDNNLEILLFDGDGSQILSLLNITDQTTGALLETQIQLTRR